MSFSKSTIVEDVKSKVRTSLRLLDEPPSLANIINIVSHTIETVDSYKNLSGEDKKMVAIVCVRTLIRDLVEDEAIETALITFVDTVGSDVIDLVIKASKGALKVNYKSILSKMTRPSCCS